MAQTLPRTMRRTTTLCSRCERLFTDPKSLHCLTRDESVPHGYFSELKYSCSLCSLIKKRLVDAALDGGEALDTSVENGKLALSLMFQDDDGDGEDESQHSNDEETIPGFESATPSVLMCWLHDETSGKSKVSMDLAWYSIPATVLDTLGLDSKGSGAISQWNKLAGLYAQDEYYKDPQFTRSIMNMVAECRKDHGNCGAKSVPTLPTMVLDVSTTCQNRRVFLHTPDPWTNCDYVALSYCWGGPQRVLTTRANRAEHEQRGIELARLPGTIADAVQVVASLGVKFLWVDALCIVQDDEATKALEMEKMGDIYANATMVLLAGGITRRVDDGFLRRLEEFAVVPIRIGSMPKVPVCLAPGDMEASHLDSRGWTFQERHLASRALEFRGSRGVSINCQESFRTYIGGGGPDGTDTWEADERKLAESLAVRKNARGLWQAMLDEYTVRRLAVAGDRLPALAGFAKTWVSSSSDTYIAGLWKTHMVDDLMWQSGVQHMGTSVRIPLDRYRSPGWSWVSVLDHDQPMLRVASFITHPQRLRRRLGGTDKEVASLVRHKVALAYAGAPFGRVLSGEITLRAQVASIPESPGGEEDKGRWEAIIAACDYQLSDEERSRLRLLRLQVGWQWNSWTSRAQRGDGGLLVLPHVASGDGSVCRRMGCFWDWVDLEDGVPMVNWDSVGFQEITLI